MTMRKQHTITLLLLSLLSITAAACAGEIGGAGGDDDGSDVEPDPEPVVCEATRTYTNLGGQPLDHDRPTIDPGTDRVRMKPYAALAAEYKAALGLAANLDTAQYAATFGRSPARWFSEPQASANTIYAAFALAYDGCTQSIGTKAEYAAAPNTAAAEVICNDFIRRAWHREPAAGETTACVDYAVNQTKASDAPAKRWAYACAAVLTSSGFLTY